MFSHTPLYSIPCSFHKKMVLIARNGHGELKKYVLAGKRFVETECICCPILKALDELQIPGTLGVGFQKSHRDSEGRPLICVGVEWDSDGKTGHLSYFVNSSGQLDMYKWSAIDNAFKATGTFQLNTSEAPREASEVLLDSEIVPINVKRCDLHGIILNATIPNGSTDQFRWNEYREQLEMINCSCQGELSDNMVLDEEGNVRITREGRKVKGKQEILMEPAVIRDLKAKSDEELNLIENSETDLFEIHGREEFNDESWIIFGELEGYDKCFLVHKNGTIVEKIKLTKEEKAEKEMDDFCNAMGMRLTGRAQEFSSLAQKPSSLAQRPSSSAQKLSSSAQWSSGSDSDVPFSNNWKSPFSDLDNHFKRKHRLRKVKYNKKLGCRRAFLERYEYNKQSLKLIELAVADLSKNFTPDEQMQLEKSIKEAIASKVKPINLPVFMTPEEREIIDKALRDGQIAQEFQEFQKKLVGEKKMKTASRPSEDFNWDDYELKSDVEGTVKNEESEESDMDYDDNEDVKPMAPESVITRDDDGCSVITDITDYSFLDDKE